MDKMSFADFVWPNNPEQYEESCARQPMYRRLEDGTEEFAGMGPMKRVITGSGAFFGNNAYANFKTLLSQLNLQAAATLTHPIWGSRQGFLTELKSRMEPMENYVAYTFEFREANASGEIPK